jgi:hypothetical protein
MIWYRPSLSVSPKWTGWYPPGRYFSTHSVGSSTGKNLCCDLFVGTSSGGVLGTELIEKALVVRLLYKEIRGMRLSSVIEDGRFVEDKRFVDDERFIENKKFVDDERFLLYMRLPVNLMLYKGYYRK